MNSVPGERAILSILAEGTRVKAGATVCELDPGPLRDELRLQRLAVQQAEAERRKAGLVAEAAKLGYEEWKAEAAEAERLANGERDLAAFALKLAEARRAGSPDQVSDPRASASEVGNARDARRTSDGRPDRRGTPAASDEEKGLAAALLAARAEERLRAEGVRRAEAELAAVEQRLALCRLAAPTDGRVVHARWHRRRGHPEGYAVIEAGARVVAGQPLFRVVPEAGLPAR